jgi:Fic family protein
MSQRKFAQSALNDLMVKYSHQTYLPPDDIKYRANLSGQRWTKLRHDLVELRKTQSLPFFFKSLPQSFWFFESDSLRQKLITIEKTGEKILGDLWQDKTLHENFIKAAATEESITSAIYEGANSSRSQARQFIAENRRPRNKDEQMLINNVQAMGWIKKTQPHTITTNQILTIHEIVTKDTMEGDLINHCGRFRNDRVFIGNHEGIDFRLVPAAMQEALDLVQDNIRYIHPLLQGILLHYFTAYIHPFFDGNGRTARTLFYLAAMNNGLHFVELLSISADLKHHGKRYERAFELVVKNEGDLTCFVDFSLDSLIAALKIVDEKVAALLSLWQLKTEPHTLNDRQITLLQRMMLNKFAKVSIDQHAQASQLSHEMARQDIKKLVDFKFLIEAKSGKKHFYTPDTKRLKESIKTRYASSAGG